MSNLTTSQLLIWTGQQLAPDVPLYNVVYTFSFRGGIDPERFAAAFQSVVDETDALRSIFEVERGVPMRRVVDAAPGAMEVVDLSAEADPEAAYEKWLDARRVRHFRLGERLFDAVLIRLAPALWIWYLNQHHLIADGWSVRLIYDRVLAHYRAPDDRRRGGSVESPSYDVCVQEEMGYRSAPGHEELREHWRRKIADRGEPLELFGSARTGRSTSVVRIRHHLEPDRMNGLKELLSGDSPETDEAGGGRSSGLSFLNAFATVLFAVLYRAAARDRLAVGTTANNRASRESMSTIGMFVEVFPLTADISVEDTLATLFEKVSRETDEFLRRARPGTSSEETNRDLSVLLNYVPLSFPGMEDIPVDCDWVTSGHGDRHHILRLSIHDLTAVGSLTLDFEFNRSALNQRERERIVEHYLRMLDALLNPEARREPISTIPLLGDSERRRVLVEWNDTGAEYPRDTSIHRLFEAQVERTPENVALEFQGDTLTYRELNERANRLARHLQHRGAGPDVLVAICLERSIEMVVAILGSLKAGGAYVPLDPGDPTKRLAVLLEDTRAPIIVTRSQHVETLEAAWCGQTGTMRAEAEAASGLVLLDRDWPSISEQSGGNPRNGADARNLAYVLYTSGSTGRPKGVCVPHLAVARLVMGADYVKPGPNEVFLQFAPISFDASTFELWGSLLHGARLVIFPPRLPSLEELGRTIEERGVSTLLLTTGVFHRLVDAHLERLRGVRQILTGGDVVSPAHARRVISTLGDRRLINGYGPTESTTFATCHVMTASSRIGDTVPIGRPISGTKAYVLDRHRQPVPPGVPGELYIGGDGLARGYLNDPERTRERFVEDPFSTEPGARLYRTGDRARHRSDGTLEFLGRLDDQVKIRGFRVEPGEIETVLAEHEAVRETIVLARHDRTGEKALVAYVTVENGTADPDEEGATIEELKRHLATRLPVYMVPSAFVVLDELPLTPSGKIDRAALPGPERGRERSIDDHARPRTPAEEALAGIWTAVLGRETVGIDDHFFDLGGHSLLAMQVVSRIREYSGVELPPTAIFDHPTIARLAGVLDAERGGAKDSPHAPLRRVSRDGDLPLSFAQQRMWFLDRLEPQNPFYNVAVAVRLRGELVLPALKHALEELTRRHEALRTTFSSRGGKVVQVVAEELAVELALVDLRQLPSDEREQEARRLAGDESLRPFDLERGPLLRARLFRLGDEEHVLLFTIHHSVFDGWSEDILARELGACYLAFQTGDDAALPELPLQYADFAVWQRAWLRRRATPPDDGPLLDRQLAYWRNRLDGLETLQLPADRSGPPVQTFRGSAETLRLPRPLRDALENLARSEGATLSMLFLAAFKVLLYRITHQEDVAVGSPVAGRNRRELEGLIGCFVNTVVLRTDLSGNPTFRELLARVREAALGAYAHQDLPFETLVEELAPERDLRRNPLFQVLFAFHTAAPDRWRLRGLKAEPFELETRATHLDLDVAVTDDPEGPLVSFVYDTERFEARTVRRMVLQLQRLLEGIRAAPDLGVAGLPLLRERERRRLVVEWNDTGTGSPPAALVPVHELFEEQVERTPRAVAVEFEGEELTYRELNGRANELARYLRRRGVGPEDLVAIAVDRGPRMLIGVLGILKAGAAYVPLDPAYPAGRQEFVLDDSGAAIVLTEGSLLERLEAAASSDVIYLDRDWPAIARESADDPPSGGANARNLAYIIYTSGSTGTPKGVEIPHGALSNFLASMRREPGLGERDTLLAVTTLSFDIAALELFLPLVVGARVVIAPREVAADGAALARRMSESGVNVLQATPSTWHMLLRSGWRDRPERKTAKTRPLKMLCGGEELPVELARQLLETGGELWNLYGPTETTIWSTLARVDHVRERIPIGRPIDNTRVYVLDAGLQPVPIGVSGELYIAGAGLARGYRGRPELTAEKFIRNPIEEEPGDRLYRTGDLARYLPDGRIEFLGRIDQQVKVRGFRIELGEIETGIERHRDVEQAVVLAREASTGHKELVAFVVPHQPHSATCPASGAEIPRTEVSPAELRGHLARVLPSYMVPSSFVVLPQLPLTPNGKVDLRALRRIHGRERDRRETAAPPVAPRTELERRLAALWEKELQRRPIGIRDNFFEIGGHSIQAAILFAGIEQALGVRLPLAALFEAPTIEQLAARLGEAAGDSAWECLVPIHPRGTRPPLYCIHGAGGNVLLYRDLARRLGPDQPVYGLQARGLDGRTRPLKSVEDMAAHYLRAIRRFQPSGPYFLAGYCMGGTVAYEVARQLTAEGDTVGLLALFETYNPHALPGRSTWSGHARILLEDVWFHLRNLSLLSGRGRLDFLRGKARVARRRLHRLLRSRWSHITRSVGRARSGSEPGIDLKRINDRAYLDYRTPEYPGDAVLFRPTDSFVGQVDPDFGWRARVTGELETVTLPVYPRGMLTEPFVERLARELRIRLEQERELEMTRSQIPDPGECRMTKPR